MADSAGSPVCTRVNGVDGATDISVSDTSPDARGNAVPNCGDSVVVSGEFCVTLSSSIPAGGGATSLAQGDFNEDGLPDLAVASIDSGGIVLLIATTPAHFNQVATTIQLVGAVAVRVADVDGDGHLDLVVGRQLPTNAVTFLWGTGTGTFAQQTSVMNPIAPSVSNLAVGDIDNDGRIDVVASSSSIPARVLVVHNNGARNFSASGTAPIPSGQDGSVALGDFDSNGFLDLVTGLAQTGTNSTASNVFLNDGRGGFPTVTRTTTVPCQAQCFVNGVGSGRLNGDSYDDVVLAIAGTAEVGVVTELSSGQGIFALPQTYDVGRSLGFPTVADVNGDTFLDIVVPGVESDSVAILLGDGAGTFVAMSSISISPLGRQPIEVVVADLNLDGEPDIASANNLTGNVSLMLSHP